MADKQEPVAWAVFCGDEQYPYDQYDEQCEARAIAKMLDADGRGDGEWRVVPLYRSPTLTDEERALLQSICDAEPTLPSVRSTLHSLLQRLGGNNG